MPDTYLLRLVLPDTPGSLGAVATAVVQENEGAGAIHAGRQGLGLLPPGGRAGRIKPDQLNFLTLSSDTFHSSSRSW